MKLTAAQYGVLHTLAEFGPKTAVEVALPRAMDGSHRTKLEWNVGSAATLSKLTTLGMVHIKREPIGCPVNAVGKRGRPRVRLTISISDAGRAALAQQ